MTNQTPFDRTYVDYLVTPNFWFSELISSNTADRNHINNYPDKESEKNLIDSCKNLFQPTRNLLNKPILISCAYRNPEVNKLVGGSNTSAHKFGYAMDFKCPGFGSPYQIVDFLQKELVKNNIKFDQIICEFNSWVHIAWKSPTGKQRGQILTAKKINGKTKYLAGLVK